MGLRGLSAGIRIKRATRGGVGMDDKNTAPSRARTGMGASRRMAAGAILATGAQEDSR
ncbi:hypothetical protein GCM10027214_35760 [Stenotrophomonas tumulicola]